MPWVSSTACTRCFKLERAAERIGQSGTGGVLEPAAEDLAEHSDPEGVAELVHRAFAHGLDLTFVVAAGFGLVAAIAVLAFVRPDRAAPAPDQEQSLADTRQTQR